MAAQKRDSVYDKTVQITFAFLGPAASRFVDRQVRNHLHKQPKDITKKDLLGLIEWIRLAVSLLTDDRKIIDDYIGQLERLAGGSKARKS
ncbi:MAG TPA: hypothetical protein VLG47_07315 [Candidatus Saccharimonadales bacterium]|nr:hypothetical protein [Candidatus Saccharimonadales bacterium]